MDFDSVRNFDMSSTTVKVKAPAPTFSSVTVPETSEDKSVDSSNGPETQVHTHIRTEEEAPPAQNQIAALQTQEAEVRRQEEEIALIQAGNMINQKIRACRQQIFSAMQRLQVCACFVPREAEIGETC